MFDNQSLIEQFGSKTENAVNLVIDVVYDVDSNTAGSIVYDNQGDSGLIENRFANSVDSVITDTIKWIENRCNGTVVYHTVYRPVDNAVPPIVLINKTRPNRLRLLGTFEAQYVPT